jgi:hypothetical protein
MLHASVEEPVQYDPPFAGLGFVQVRVFIPPPHSLLQFEKDDHPPLIFDVFGTQSELPVQFDGSHALVDGIVLYVVLQ